MSKPTKYSYPIVAVSLRGGNVLELWDGPFLAYATAKRLIGLRRKQYPDRQFFMYRDEFRKPEPK